MPFVSVIMPAYNAARTIAEAIESVLQQTYTDFELIILNDFSNDETKYIIKKYIQDVRIVYIENEKNLGVSETRNRGISMAKGEWIAFLDSDDIWEKDKLQKQIELIQIEKDVILCYTSSAFMDKEGNRYNYVLKAVPYLSYKTLLKRNLISCSSAVVRSDVIRKLKMPGDQMHEDYYVWLTILKHIPYAYGIAEPLIVYRLSQNSKSSNRLKSAKMVYNTYRATGYSEISAVYLTLRYAIYSIRKRMRIKHSK